MDNIDTLRSFIAVTNDDNRFTTIQRIEPNSAVLRYREFSHTILGSRILEKSSGTCTSENQLPLVELIENVRNVIALMERL